MSPWTLSILLSALIAFVNTAGACLTGFMVANQALTMPTAAAWVFAGVTGLIGAAKDVQSKMSQKSQP